MDYAIGEKYLAGRAKEPRAKEQKSIKTSNCACFYVTTLDRIPIFLENFDFKFFPIIMFMIPYFCHILAFWLTLNIKGVVGRSLELGVGAGCYFKVPQAQKP